MSIFKRKKLEPKKRQLYSVRITTEVLVYANNRIHAQNLIKEVRENIYESYKNNNYGYSISEMGISVR